MASDLWKIPNLVTLGRLLLLIPTAVFLSHPDPVDKIYALAFLTVAAISDFLDGFLARRLKQQTQLGLLLDPLSDKVMALSMTILLIFYRQFPLWLAALIIGRDIVLALGALLLKSKVRGIPPSNLTGKYTFAAIAVLLVSYVIEFNDGIRLCTPPVVVFCLLSLIIYSRAFARAWSGKALPCFRDKPVYQMGRTFLTLSFSMFYIYRLFVFLKWI
jgi:cardiolipin synthase